MRKLLFYLTIAVTVVLFVLVNIFSNLLFSGSQIDFTEQKVYTLSSGTLKAIKSFDEPITMKFFYSKEQANGFPTVQAYAARVQSLLKQYALLSEGNIKLEFINPRPYSEEEDSAISYGLKGARVDSMGTKLYFGLVAYNSVDDVKVIPFFDIKRSSFLEYDLTHIVHSLSRPKKPVIGVLSWLPMKVGMTRMIAQPTEPWAVFQNMQKMFDVKTINVRKATKIPEGIDILMIVHPTSLSETLLKDIDRFISNGGKALIFVDPYSSAPSIEKTSSSLPKLFEKWGLLFDTSKAVADRSLALRIPIKNDDEFNLMPDVANVTWIDIGTEGLNPDSLITASLRSIRMLSAGSLGLIAPAEGSNVKWTPLVITTDESMLVDSDSLIKAGIEQELLANYEAGGEPFAVAAEISGTLPSAFNEESGNIGEEDKKEESHVVIVADVDMLRDEVWMKRRRFLGEEIFERLADNGAFVINILDYLSGSDELMELRGRSNITRPFDVVDKLRYIAESKYYKKEKKIRERIRRLERQIDIIKSSIKVNSESVLSKGQVAELQKFRKNIIAARKELKEVRHALRKDIKSLGSKLKFLNIGLIPIILLLLAFFMPNRLRRVSSRYYKMSRREKGTG